MGEVGSCRDRKSGSQGADEGREGELCVYVRVCWCVL